jgi:hypothetical protein
VASLVSIWGGEGSKCQVLGLAACVMVLRWLADVLCGDALVQGIGRGCGGAGNSRRVGGAREDGGGDQRGETREELPLQPLRHLRQVVGDEGSVVKWRTRSVALFRPGFRTGQSPAAPPNTPDDPTPGHVMVSTGLHHARREVARGGMNIQYP